MLTLKGLDTEILDFLLLKSHIALISDDLSERLGASHELSFPIEGHLRIRRINVYDNLILGEATSLKTGENFSVYIGEVDEMYRDYVKSGDWREI